MTAMANMGSLVVALPPADIWLTDEQAADFLGYAGTYFKASIICLKGFPKPRYITDNSKGRRWNLKMLSDWLSERPEDFFNIWYYAPNNAGSTWQKAEALGMYSFDVKILEVE